MIDLDLLALKHLLKVKKQDGKTWIFDRIRRKWLVLQPEELVRQLLIHYLIEEKGYNSSRISLEKGLKVNKIDKRFDVLVYSHQLKPLLLAECKAPHVDISHQTFRQIAWYNMTLKVPFLVVTNGLTTFCCRVDHQQESYDYLEEIPSFLSIGEP